MIQSSFHFSPSRSLGIAGCFLLLLAVTAGFAFAKPTPAEAPAPPATYQPPSYFFTVDLDPHYQFVGTGALTEEQAATASCYRFIYNSSGKLQQVEYRRAKVLMPDPLFQVAQINIEYQDGIERRTFQDEHNQPVASVDGIYGEELTLNKAGVATEIANLSDTGGKIRDNSGVLRYVRTLDEQNRVVALRRFGLLGTPITDENGFYETRTAYDEQGRVMERGNYDESGKPLNNADGVALVRTLYTLYPDSTLSIESYYDATSLPAEEKSTGVHQRQRTFDKRGLLIDEAYFDASGAPTTTAEDRVHERRYTYDDRGNEITEEYLGIDGKPVNMKGPDFAKIVYKYDDKNRVIEKDYFGDDGAPQVAPNLGAAIIRQTYNTRGELVRREFFDGQGHPSNHVQYGTPAIRIKVEGDMTVVTLRNANDQPTKNPIHGYYSFSYKTSSDTPLSRSNRYFDRHGRSMSLLRITFINPHLHELETSPVMKWSARLGAAGVGLGALLACFLALRKSSHTKRRKVYVPTPVERFLGWFSVLAILEGILRFVMTLYWTFISLENGRMGPGFHILETIFILFFLYRLYRLTRTMRVLNIEKEDIHRVVRDFFAKVGEKPEWIEKRHRYVTALLDVRVNYFRQKYHAYLAFGSRGKKGAGMERDIAAYIRAQVGGILAPVRTRSIALYYPSVAFCYFLLAGIGFYTLYQLIKAY
jgi:YD repeat-containing protein